VGAIGYMKKNRFIGISCIVLALCLVVGISTSVYTESLKKDVVNKFITIFYDNQETKDNEYKSRLIKKVSPLLSSNYKIQSFEMDWLPMNVGESNENVAKYEGYTISKISKEKVNNEKVIVYSVDVEFSSADKSLEPKLLYIELIKENSEWKISKLMPRSI